MAFVQEMTCYQYTLLLCCCILTLWLMLYVHLSFDLSLTWYTMLGKLCQCIDWLSLRVDALVTTVMTWYWFYFHFSIQRLPLSQAIVLSFTTPIMASIAARIILHEKLKIADIGGMVVCKILSFWFLNPLSM